MVKRHPDVVFGTLEKRESPAVLAPATEPRFPSIGSVDQGQAAWVYRGQFLDLKHSIKHEQRVLVYCDRASLWSSGQAMAKKGVIKFFDLRLQTERPPGHLADFVLLGVACEGQYDFQTNTVHSETAEGFR